MSVPPRVPDPAGPDATATATAEPIVAGARFSGRYRLTALVARGGMAEVWEAQDEVLSRPVAFKVLPTHLAADRSFVERFHREAVVAARLGHPSVVATYDTGVDRGTAFIVMELVRGQTLRDLLARTGALDALLAVSIATQIADALAHAHRAGLVHRDIKPANVLLCDDDGGPPRVKVADFGIAKSNLPGADLTRTGSVLGTPKYLSPEQVRGDTDPDARSDLYALGVVLFEMLTGRPPLVGTTEMSTALAHLNEVPPAPSSLRSGIPPALDALVAALLAKSPGARPPTAVAARQQLELVARDLASARRSRPVPTRTQAPDGAPPLAATRPSSGPDSRSRTALRPRSALNGAVGTATRVEPSTPLPAHAGPTERPDRGGVRTAAAPPPAPRTRRRRRWGPGIVVAALVVVAVGVAVVLVRHSSLSSLRSAVTHRPAVPADITPISASVWMDNDRPPDNPGEAHLAIEGSPTKAWTTDQYDQPDAATFHGLYDGIGLAVELPRNERITSLSVVSTTQHWSASVYVADSRIASGGSVSAWGRPVASLADIDGDATFRTGGGTGRWVLLWLTNIGPGGKASIADVTAR